ncbi:MAG TPA: hypothetical protein VGN12_30310 [Pirellulales bacterium]|jgi:hypothetical protein
MTAWEVTVEDINVVLAFHGVSVPAEQVYDLLGELDADAIIDGLLHYDDFGDQAMLVIRRSRQGRF